MSTRPSRPTRLILTLAASLALLVASVPAALAAGPATAGLPGSIVGGPTSTQSSTYFSGYSAYMFGGSFSKVSATWKVPKVTCDGTDEAMFIWVGLDDNGHKYLEQAGTAAWCPAGSLSPSYYPWYEMFPKPSTPISSLSIKPGDSIRTTVWASSSTFTFKIEDLTTGKSFSIKKAQAGAKRLAAYWIVEAPWKGSSSKSLYNLPKFTPTTIDNGVATANGHGHPIGSSAWNMIGRWTMKTTGGTVKASTSGLTGADRFTVSWHHR